jgi:hypothetical protein
MNVKFKTTAAFILSLLLLVPGQTRAYYDEAPADESIEASSEESSEESTEEAEAEEAEEDSSSKKKKKKKKKSEEPPRTEEEAMADMDKVASKGELNLYMNKKEGTVCLEDTKSGKRWFSNPVDLQQSNAKKLQKDELAAGMTLTYAEPYKRATTTQNSKAGAKLKM